MMKKAIKEQKSFNSEPYSFFIKKDSSGKIKGYYTSKNSISSVSPRRAITRDLSTGFSKRILNIHETYPIVHANYNQSYSDGVRRLLNQIDSPDGSEQRLIVRRVSVAQDKIDYLPWIAAVSGLFRLVTTENNGSTWKVSLINVEWDRYLSPVDRIDFNFNHMTLNGSARWILQSINFTIKPSLDSELHPNNNISIISKNGSTLLNSNSSKQFIPGSGVSNENKALVVNSSGYVGTLTSQNNRNNDPLGEFYTMVFEKINTITLSNGGAYNYDVPSDARNLSKLIELDWCRITNGTTTISQSSMNSSSTKNVFFTQPNSTWTGTQNQDIGIYPGANCYYYYDFLTQRTNLLNNGGSNSSAEFTNYLINSIESAYAENDDDMYIVRVGNATIKLYCDFCSNSRYAYFRRTVENCIQENDNYEFLGSKSEEAGDFTYTEYFLDTRNKQRIKSTIKVTRLEHKKYRIENMLEILNKTTNPRIPSDSIRKWTADSTETEYKVYNVEDLRYLATIVNAGNSLAGITITQANDIVINHNLLGKDFEEPIEGDNAMPNSKYINLDSIGTGNGSSAKSFAGTYDGNGKIISGLYIYQGHQGLGFFGNIAGATIKKVTILDSCVINKNSSGSSNSSDDDRFGGLIGMIQSASTIQDCIFEGVVGSQAALDRGGYYEYMGGLVGYCNEASTAENCITLVKIKASRNSDLICGANNNRLTKTNVFGYNASNSSQYNEGKSFINNVIAGF